MANEFSSPRVVVREQRSGVPQIRGTSKSTGAFIGRTARGPSRAIRVTSYTMYERIYGGPIDNSYMAENVDAFFKNGGSECYIVRVLGSSGGSNVKADVTLAATTGATSGSLASGASAFPLGLASGSTFTGKVDGGGAVTLTITANKAVYTGAAATYAAVTASHVLVVHITGEMGDNDQTITFAGTENSQALFLTAINDQLIGASAINSGGQIKFQTDKGGTGAAGYINGASSSADVLASLGLPGGTTNFTLAGGSNVADNRAITSAEFAALATAVFVGSTVVANSAGQVTWASDATGGSSSVQFTAGTGVGFVDGFDLAVHSGAASGSTDILTVEAIGAGVDCNAFTVKSANTDVKLATSIPTTVTSGTITSITLSAATVARLAVGDTIKLYNPGTSTTARGIIARIQNNVVTFSAGVVLSGNLTNTTTTVTLETFSLTLLYNGNVVQGPVAGLRLSSLSKKNYFETVLNAQDDEALITVSDEAAVQGALDLRPVNADSAGDPLASGAEAGTFADTDYIGSQSLKTGFYALNAKKDVRLVAVPGVSGIDTAGAISKSLVDYCENRADCVAIIAPPQGLTSSQVDSYVDASLGSSSYVAMYHPWVEIVGPLSGVREAAPPEGFVMGMIARCDRDEGIQKAPAGDFTGRLRGTIGLVGDPLDDDDTDLLYPKNVNCILDLDVGQCVFGARTMENGEFNSLHIRRTFIYLERSLQTGTRFAIFIENTEEGRAKVERAISAFLEAEWYKGTLAGKTIDEAFTCVCDDSNNPLPIVKQRLMVADVDVNVPETAENLLIPIRQKQGSVSTSAAA